MKHPCQLKATSSDGLKILSQAATINSFFFSNEGELLKSINSDLK